MTHFNRVTDQELEAALIQKQLIPPAKDNRLRARKDRRIRGDGLAAQGVAFQPTNAGPIRQESPACPASPRATIGSWKSPRQESARMEPAGSALGASDGAVRFGG